MSLSLWAEMSSYDEFASRVWFQYKFHDVWVCEFAPCSHTAKCTLTQFSRQQTQHFNSDHDSSICLACHMLLLCHRMDWTVELKIRHKHEPTIHAVMKKSLQHNEGHLPLVPYCRNQRNSLYSFLSSSTVCIWTHLPQQHALWINLFLICHHFPKWGL
jgi:hypothetical protein